MLNASGEKAARAREPSFPTWRCSGSSKSLDATSSSPHSQNYCTRPYPDGRGLSGHVGSGGHESEVTRLSSALNQREGREEGGRDCR